jgi:hypothetical protein
MYLGDLCPPQDFAGDLILFGHGGEVAVGGSQRRSEVDNFWQTSHGGCGWRNTMGQS